MKLTYTNKLKEASKCQFSKERTGENCGFMCGQLPEIAYICTFHSMLCPTLNIVYTHTVYWLIQKPDKTEYI